jgi:hypothetical protein
MPGCDRARLVVPRTAKVQKCRHKRCTAAGLGKVQGTCVVRYGHAQAQQEVMHALRYVAQGFR